MDGILLISNSAESAAFARSWVGGHGFVFISASLSCSSTATTVGPPSAMGGGSGIAAAYRRVRPACDSMPSDELCNIDIDIDGSRPTSHVCDRMVCDAYTRPAEFRCARQARRRADREAGASARKPPKRSCASPASHALAQTHRQTREGVVVIWMYIMVGCVRAAELVNRRACNRQKRAGSAHCGLSGHTDVRYSCVRIFPKNSVKPSVCVLKPLG